jgi:sodium-coupled monocarboxylate transporter 8/12
MSTISAGLNSLASATVIDFKQRLRGVADQPQAQQVGQAKLVTVGYGVLVIAFAFVVSTMEQNLVESVNTIIGLVGGPLLGMFFLGMFTKLAETRGALTGCIAGFSVVLPLHLYQNGFLTAEKPDTIVSFIWFSLIGCSVTMIVGLITSALFGKR